jgi:hypothetical protein
VNFKTCFAGAGYLADPGIFEDGSANDPVLSFPAGS